MSTDRALSGLVHGRSFRRGVERWYMGESVGENTSSAGLIDPEDGKYKALSVGVTLCVNELAWEILRAASVIAEVLTL